MQACYYILEDSLEATRFITGCALTQTREDGQILTGPIVFRGDMEALTLLTFPENVTVTLYNSAGEEIEVPIEGEPFFVAVPDTEESYKVTLVVGIQGETDGDGNGDDNGSLFRAVSGMLAASQARAEAPVLPPNVTLPEGFVVYAALTFYVNPRGSNCCCNCGCGNNNRCGCDGWHGGVGSAPAPVLPEQNEFSNIRCCWYH